jgi:hypothetical protein
MSSDEASRTPASQSSRRSANRQFHTLIVSALISQHVVLDDVASRLTTHERPKGTSMPDYGHPLRFATFIGLHQLPASPSGRVGAAQ